MLSKGEKEKLLEFIKRQKRPWTKEEVEKLKEAMELGASALSIFRAGILPRRTKGSIDKKITELRNANRK